MLTKFSPKIPKFYCEFCKTATNNKKDFEKHILTAKHHKNVSFEHSLTNFPQKSQTFCCLICDKQYKSRVGLWYHDKKCKHMCKSIQTENIIDMFKQQIQENKELHKMIIDQNKQIIELSKEKSTNIINTNCNNKFNLNFFLNEQCKDALNMEEFINSLKIQLIDLENTAKVGYVEGISKIFLNGLKELDLYKRPVHCSDLKREVLYVKDEDKWEKENEDNKKMKKVIHQITHKNIKQIPEWAAENPLCKDSSSKKNDEYMKIISNCMSGDCNEEQSSNITKIISKVAKEVFIDKSL